MHMTHEEFATPKSRDYLRRSIPEVSEGLARGAIPNARLVECKFLIGRAYEYERDLLHDNQYKALLASGVQHWQPAYQAVTDLIPYGLTTAGSIRNKVAKLRKVTDGNLVLEAIAIEAEAFLDRWHPMVEGLKALKLVAVKGRQPIPDSERKTPPRTIEHTGSCACCTRNVKLSDADKIVDHGFQLHWNSRAGNCSGVGFPPLEMAPDGIAAFIERLEGQLNAAEKARKNLAEGPPAPVYDGLSKKTITPDDPLWPRMRAIRISDYESEIGFIGREIESQRLRIEKWEPAPLPDGRSDHMPQNPSP